MTGGALKRNRPSSSRASHRASHRATRAVSRTRDAQFALSPLALDAVVFFAITSSEVTTL